MNKNSLYEFDRTIRKEHKNILGLDEVGRGCVAGPLVVVGLVLDQNYINDEIMDSKKIKSMKKRKELATEILNNCIDCKIKIFSAKDVDELNPKRCAQHGMNLIAKELKNKYNIALTDFEKMDNSINQLNLTKGDSKSFTIAAASIVAKHIRDEQMIILDKKYPQYDFLNNQGYLTKKHKELIKKFNIIEGVYRLSYKPIKNIINRK